MKIRFFLNMKLVNFAQCFYFNKKKIMREVLIVGFAFLIFSIMGCQQSHNPNWEQDVANADYIHRSMKKLTDVIVHDIISPPVAARDYAYPSIAAYEALLPAFDSHVSYAGQLNGLTTIPPPDASKKYCFPLASVHAFLKTSESFIFDVTQIEDFRTELYLEMDSVINMPAEVKKRSIEYGEMVAAHILDWAKKDNYAESRSFSKYEIPFDDPSKWKPTPPDFMDGIEPHWRTIRPFVLKKPDQFKQKHRLNLVRKKEVNFTKRRWKCMRLEKIKRLSKLKLRSFGIAILSFLRTKGT